MVYGYSLMGTRDAGAVRNSVSLNLKLFMLKLTAFDGDAELMKVMLWSDQLPYMYSLLEIPRSSIDSFSSQSKYIVILLALIFLAANKPSMRLGAPLPREGYTPNMFLQDEFVVSAKNSNCSTHKSRLSPRHT